MYKPIMLAIAGSVLVFPLFGCFLESDDYDDGIFCIYCCLAESQPAVALDGVEVPVIRAHRIETPGGFTVELDGEDDSCALSATVTLIDEELAVHASVDGRDLGDPTRIEPEYTRDTVSFRAHFNDGTVLAGQLVFFDDFP